MKFHISFITILFLACSLGNNVFAQRNGSKGKIIGSLVDADTKAPLEFATITLLSPQDSGLINGVISNGKGEFEINANPGTYLIKMEFISYQGQYKSGVVVAAGQTVELGSFSLSPEAQVLEGVEVRAEKSTMQMALDKKIFNVGKDLASTSGSAAEVLDNIPSVQVDIEGQVSLRGSGGVRILVDGKPSGLIGVRGTDGLRSLPANLIERVEVITNPSARYEAEGMSGIINIILKKDRKKGLNGAIDISAGTPESAGASFNLNFRQKKLNFFTNYGFRHRNRPRINTIYQELYREDQTLFVDQERNSTRGGQSHNFRFGADYFANDNNTLTGSLSYRISDGKNTSDIIYRNYRGSFPDNPTGTNRRTELSEEDEPNLEFSLNHKKTFKSKGHEWNNSIQYRESSESQFSQFEEKTLQVFNDEFPVLNLDQCSSNDEGEKSLLLQSDYVMPFAKEGKFELGYRGSLRRINNKYLVENFDDIQWVRQPNLSNDFNYDEDIHAIYTSIGNKIN